MKEWKRRTRDWRHPGWSVFKLHLKVKLIGKMRRLEKECGLRKRNVNEGIESLRDMHCRKKVLNSFESLTVWGPILDKYFKDENEQGRALKQNRFHHKLVNTKLRKKFVVYFMVLNSSLFVL